MQRKFPLTLAFILFAVIAGCSKPPEISRSEGKLEESAHNATQPPEGIANPNNPESRNVNQERRVPADLEHTALVGPKDTGDVGCLTVSPDGQFLAWYAQKFINRETKCSICVWSLRDNRLCLSHPVEGQVSTLGFAPRGNLLCVSVFFDPDGIQLWDIVTWKKQGVLGTETAYGLAFSPDGKDLVTSSIPVKPARQSQLRVWEIRSKQSRVITNVSLSDFLCYRPDGRFIGIGDFRGNIRVWDLQLGKEHWSFQHSSMGGDTRRSLSGLAFNPTDSTLVSSGGDGWVRVWDILKKQMIREFDGKVGDIEAMAVSPDGKVIAVSGINYRDLHRPGRIRLWAASTGIAIGEIDSLNMVFFSLCFSSDSTRLIGGSSGGPEKEMGKGDIRFWKVSDLTLKDKR